MRDCEEVSILNIHILHDSCRVDPTFVNALLECRYMCMGCRIGL